MKERLYILIDLDDEYELPLAVCDTQREMAVVAGTTKDNVASCLSKVRRGENKRSRFVEVEV